MGAEEASDLENEVLNRIPELSLEELRQSWRFNMWSFERQMKPQPSPPSPPQPLRTSIGALDRWKRLTSSRKITD